MITPVRDGMNLVAKEYVATRTDQSGVLILSEMAGAAKELNKALLVNPSDTEALADALQTALEMPVGEQVSRNKSLQQRIRRYSVTRWAESFMQALLKAYDQREPHTAKKIGEATLEEMTSQFEKAKKRLVFLDYDGTLSPFHDNPEMATPKDEVLNALEKIQSMPNTQLVIISGRDRDTLGTWFRNFPFVLVAEHGMFMRTSDGEWSGSDQLRNDWMEHIRPVLQTFVDRTPGTFIEEKKHALAWHYRKTDPELAQNRVVELKTLLNSLISDNLKMLDGNKVIEIVHNKTNKGAAATQILADWPADFVMAIGDDVTDEDMFIELPPESWTVKVGFQKTEASYCVSNTDEVAALLKTLAEAI
jgi:trehalose 6-phosphate synthase/phosphatase